MNQGQDLQVRLTLKCLENILSCEEKEKEKEKIANLIQRVGLDRSYRDAVSVLNPTQLKMFTLLRDGFFSFRDAFRDIVKDSKYNQVSNTPGFNISDYLINIQSKIIIKDKLTGQNVISKYTVENLKLIKIYPSWPKSLLNHWNEIAREKILALEQRRNEASQQKEKLAEIKVEPPPEVVVKKKVEEPRYQDDSDSEDNYSEEIKPKQAYKIEKEPERRVVIPPAIQKPLPVEKPSARRIQTKIEQRMDNRVADSRQAKCKQMERYLDTRKDLVIERSKIKDVVELLTSRLDNFLRKSAERMADLACLRNKRNPKMGNQVEYFSTGNGRIIQQAPFYIQPNSKVYMLQYKHKLEVYTTLRAKEIKKEDDLRAALEANTNDNEKKVDKKIQNYILKPRPKQVQPIEIFKEERDPGRANNNLTICTEHAIFFLQNHRFLRNSLLLFNAYHY